MIPHRLEAILGNGKGNAAHRAFHAIGDAFRRGMGGGGVARDIVIDPVGRRGAAMGGIDVHPIVRIFLEQGLGAFRQLVGIIAEILAR